MMTCVNNNLYAGGDVSFLLFFWKSNDFIISSDILDLKTIVSFLRSVY